MTKGKVRVVVAATFIWTSLAIPVLAQTSNPKTETVGDLQQAANAGDTSAQFELGNRYSAGKDLAKDDSQALIWWQKAADQGNGDAMARLSGYYLQKDATLSGEWQRKAAEHGHAMSAQNLGQEYEDQGNYHEAYRWYREAIKDGQDASAYGLVRVTVKMYPELLRFRATALQAHGAGDAPLALRTPPSPLPLSPNPSPVLETDPRTMSPARVMALLMTAPQLKVEPKHTIFEVDRFDRDRRSDIKACNGGKVSAGAIGTTACLNIFSANAVLATSKTISGADRFYIMSVLLRGCGVYALSSERYEAMDGRSCGILGRYLWELGNEEAAKTVWESAPGCYSIDHRGGTPVSACVASILGAYSQHFISRFDPYIAYKSQPERLVRLMWKSCTTVHDRDSCEFLTSNGANVDMAAVQEAENDRHDAIEENRERNREESAQAQADSEARRNALFGALQSMGGGDPNLIANTANQQAAAIRAIGDTNAARQQAAQQMAEQRAASATNQVASNAASQGDAKAVETAEPVQTQTPEAAQPPTNGTTTPVQLLSGLPSTCINQFWDPQNYNWLSLQNTCSQPVYVSFIFHDPSGWAMNGAMNLAPGAHQTTGLSGDNIKQAGGFEYYVCPAKTVPVDLNGNVLRSNVPAFRCKPL